SVPISERSAKIETVRTRAQPKEQRQRRAECRVSVRGNGRNEKEKMWAGGDVLSHPVSRAVPSAPRGLTAVFGMGTGVAPAPWPPASTPHFVLLMTNGGSRERGFGKARLGRRSREYAQGDRPTVVSCRHSHPYGEGGKAKPHGRLVRLG